MRWRPTNLPPVLPLLVTLLSVGCSGHAPQVVMSAAGAVKQDAALGEVDHQVWHNLLRKYVDENGMVDYEGWKASPDDREALKQYLATLSAADPGRETSKEGRLAFWINAYNALTVHGILKEYPTSSIRNHTAKVFGYNIWDDLLLPVGDKKYSLNQIEHEVLRKMGEPRIHFAIVCASVGCPRLLNEAYVPEKLDQQLSINASDFFSRERNLQVEFENRKVRASAIFDWFGEDFGDTPQEALASVSTYMPDERTRKFIGGKEYSVSYLDYDWSLNEQ